MILALFGRLLQSVKWDSVEEANHDMDGLVEAVRTAVYESFEPMKLNFLFLNIQVILEEMINRQGDNDYDISHTMGKAALEQQGILPERLLLGASEDKVRIGFGTFLDELDGYGEDMV